MNIRTILLALMLFICAEGSYAQVGPPVNLELGFGGGLTLPSADLSDVTDAGYNLGIKARIGGLMPINLAGAVLYNRLPLKSLSSEAATSWILSVGPEFTIPSIMVKPYFGADALVNMLSSTLPNASTETRFGLGLGGGAVFSVPALGSFDASVKYQMLNLIGKETNESNSSQIMLNVSLMFGVLGS